LGREGGVDKKSKEGDIVTRVPALRLTIESSKQEDGGKWLYGKTKIGSREARRKTPIPMKADFLSRRAQGETRPRHVLTERERLWGKAF